MHWDALFNQEKNIVNSNETIREWIAMNKYLRAKYQSIQTGFKPFNNVANNKRISHLKGIPADGNGIHPGFRFRFKVSSSFDPVHQPANTDADIIIFFQPKF